mgnify:CR=1 FL=1
MHANRTDIYAERLSRLIRSETVSTRIQPDKTKFYSFQNLLRQMFPTLYSIVEWEDFDGSFLLRWKGLQEMDPILLMNHHDVVEAPGSWTHEPFSRTIASARYPFKTYPCIICWGNRLGRQKTPFVRHVFFIRA